MSGIGQALTGSSQKTSTTSKNAPYVDAQGEALVNFGNSAYFGTDANGKPNAPTTANLTPLQQYSGQRVDDLNPTLAHGLEIANDSVGITDPYFSAGQSALGQATGDVNSSYTGAQGDLSDARGYTGASTDRYGNPITTGNAYTGISNYINPYLDNALSPVLRNLKQSSDIADLQRQSTAASHGAFGGSRDALASAYNSSQLAQNESDAIAKAHSDAWDKAISAYSSDADRGLKAQEDNQGQFNAEQNRLLAAGGQSKDIATAGSGIGVASAGALSNIASGYGALATQKENAINSTFDRLQTAGTYQQANTQKNSDDAYAQFIENRDYPKSVLQTLSGTLQQSPGQNGEAVSTTSSPSLLGQIGGLAATAAGTYFGGPAGGALASNIFSSATSQGANDLANQFGHNTGGYTGYIGGNTV